MRDRYWQYIENGGDPANPPDYLAEEPHIEESSPRESSAGQDWYVLSPGRMLYKLGIDLD
jgi:hypothetical protein